MKTLWFPNLQTVMRVVGELNCISRCGEGSRLIRCGLWKLHAYVDAGGGTLSKEADCCTGGECKQRLHDGIHWLKGTIFHYRVNGKYLTTLFRLPCRRTHGPSIEELAFRDLVNKTAANRWWQKPSQNSLGNETVLSQENRGFLCFKYRLGKRYLKQRAFVCENFGWPPT